MSDVESRSWLRRSVLIVAVALSVAGCSGSSSPASAPSSQNLSAPTQTGSLGHDDRADVRAAYTQFWSVSLHASERPEATWQGELAAVAVDPQLTTTLDAMRRQDQTGIVVYGDVTARIVSIQISGSSATVIDCQDASRTGQADAKTGRPKTVGVPRNPVSTRLERGNADGLWKVAKVSFRGGEC